MNRLALAENVMDNFRLSIQQKATLAKAVREAQEALLLKGEHRLLIADISIRLNAEIFGSKESLNSSRSKLLRTMLADHLGFTEKVIWVWIDVKRHVCDHIPREEMVKHSYQTLFEAKSLIKNKKVSVREALAEVTESESEHRKRVKLMLRYSAELLTSCRKYRGQGSQDINEVKYRLRECARILP